MTVNGLHCLFTGGMSWGDVPTDIFDSVNLLGMSGLLDEHFGPVPPDVAATRTPTESIPVESRTNAIRISLGDPDE